MRDRQELGGFLRSRRARVTPQSAGLPGGSRRRVPGLRREELAQVAGISVEYYQRLEQGRATRPSEEVLDAIARVLRLDDVRRAHLHRLARPPRGPVPATDQAAGQVRPELQHMLTLMDRIPALIINDGFDLLAANPLATRIFTAVNIAPAANCNMARYLFLDPAARDFHLEWAGVAAATAGQLRLATGRHPGDPNLTGLVTELTTSSEDFRALWDAGDVEQRSCGAKSLRHPALGVLTLHYENFEPISSPRQRLITFTPEPQSATEAALHLLATWAAPAQARPRAAADRLVIDH
ncbi:MAG: transcriptional regulator [Pseudonocardiales bacterium]|nr:MAG: transcriptional regulator [Pseudonocardiales bacterium]